MQILAYTSNLGYFIGTRGERRCMVAVELNNSPNIQQNVMILLPCFKLNILNIFAGFPTFGGATTVSTWGSSHRSGV